MLYWEAFWKRFRLQLLEFGACPHPETITPTKVGGDASAGRLAARGAIEAPAQ